MDAGIIKVFKGLYRVKMARKLITLVEEEESIPANFLKMHQAVEMAVKSWEEVSSTTISNCFRHCGFYKAKVRIEEAGTVESTLVEPVFEEIDSILASYSYLNPSGTRDEY